MNQSDDAKKNKTGQTARTARITKSSLVDTGLDPFKAEEARSHEMHSSAEMPMGSALVPAGGATFRVWAPTALQVYVAYGLSNDDLKTWQPSDQHLLQRDQNGYWSGYFSDATEGACYLFWIVGQGGSGFKRDPRARELEIDGYPDFINDHPEDHNPYCPCIVRDHDFPWHDMDFKMPPFHQLIIYQFHIGVFYARRNGIDIRHNRVSKFLDTIDRIEYLADLGINAIQPLPVVEWQGPISMGYNNTDFYSPEMDYALNVSEIDPYLERVNELLAKKNQPPMIREQLASQVNQLKAMIDLFHLYGIAVILDVVYNHGGGPFDLQSMRFFDRPANQEWWDKDNYFIPGDGWAGGRIFDYSSDEVRQFLIDNARMFLDEYHADGFRYDEVSVIDNNGGAQFCRDITSTLHYHKPASIHIAEYWNQFRAVPVQDSGLGFDATLSDGIREALRGAIKQAASGKFAHVNLDGLRNSLRRPAYFPASWKAVNYIESHDVVKADRDDPAEIEPRISALANWNNRRDWFARSRSRVAAGLLLTAPGIPMMFMGQEFLEDKPWHTNPALDNFFIYWEGLHTDSAMIDFRRFVADACKLRRNYPALCGEGINPYFNHNSDRIIAFQRWVEGEGKDMVIVASLNEAHHWAYQMPFPMDGHWKEVFNSDAYDSMTPEGGFNPNAVGNIFGITADGPPLYGCPVSAAITIPANGLLVFIRV